MKKTIVAYRWDALGERMCAFLNAMYLADKFGYHFSFLWDPIFEENLSTHTFPNIPEKEYFFSKDFIKNHYFNENVKKIYNQWIESVWYSENTFEAIKNKTMFEWGIFCPYQGNLSDQFMDIDKLTYERKIKKYWNSIKFSNQIQETIDSANQTAVKLKNFIGIHIRTSDITRRYNGNHMYLCLLKGFPIYLAVDIIEKITTNIVLFGDDFEAIGDLKKQIYWRKNIFTVEELIDLSKLDVVQRTIFDVVLMSKSAQIYASGYSGFSNLAMRIGTCENMVSIYNYYSVEERYKILINNLKRYDFSIYQKSYAYIHLYEYSRNLNFCLNTQKKIILKGMKVRPDALIFSIFYINILFKECKFNKIEYFLSKKNLKLYLQNLLEPGWGIYLYHYLFKKYLIPRKNFYINCIALYLIFDMLQKQYFEFQKEMICFLLYFRFNKKIEKKFNSIFDNTGNIIKYLKDLKKSILTNEHVFMQSACIRVYNHLSYKLGYYIVNNFNSFFDFIKLPFELLKITKQHKRDIKLNKTKIKIDKNSLDFDKALKEMESFTYKLGQEIINAHKNWYKGGYIFLWFRIIKLKKEIQKEEIK